MDHDTIADVFNEPNEDPATVAAATAGVVENVGEDGTVRENEEQAVVSSTSNTRLRSSSSATSFRDLQLRLGEGSVEEAGGRDARTSRFR